MPALLTPADRMAGSAICRALYARATRSCSPPRLGAERQCLRLRGPGRKRTQAGPGG